MEAHYSRAKLLEHGAESPDMPMATAATVQRLTANTHPSYRLTHYRTTLGTIANLQNQ